VIGVGFEVRYGEDRYAIGRLILLRAADIGLSRSDFVRRLGYHNMAKGHRTLSRMLTTGLVADFMQPSLAAALEIHPVALDAAVVATAAQHRAEKEARLNAKDTAYRTAFRPHIRAEVERAVPTPLFVAIVYGPALRIVPLADEAWTTDEVARRRLIERAIVGHYRRWRGRLPSYGRITGYLAVSGTLGHYDVGVPYAVDGNPIGPPMIVDRIGVGALTINGHPIPSKWFDARSEAVGGGKPCVILEWPIAKPSDP